MISNSSFHRERLVATTGMTEFLHCTRDAVLVLSLGIVGVACLLLTPTSARWIGDVAGLLHEISNYSLFMSDLRTIRGVTCTWLVVVATAVAA